MALALHAYRVLDLNRSIREASRCNMPGSSSPFLSLRSRSFALNHPPAAPSSGLSGNLRYRVPFVSGSGKRPPAMFTCSACKISFGIGRILSWAAQSYELGLVLVGKMWVRSLLFRHSALPARLALCRA